MNVKDKNSKAYKKSRRQKALAYGASVRATNRKRKADEAALRQEYRAEHPTPKGKGLRVKRTMAMRFLALLTTYPLYGKDDPWVNFCKENRQMILETPHIHSYAFEVTRG